MARTRAQAIKHDRELDARGLSCPLPALRARVALSRMASGEILRIVSTDSGSPHDLKTLVKNTGNRVVGQSSSRKEFVFYVLKT